MMSRKDFEIVAKSLAECLEQTSAGAYLSEALVRKFARDLSQTNPRFDNERFVNAVLNKMYSKEG